MNRIIAIDNTALDAIITHLVNTHGYTIDALHLPDRTEYQFKTMGDAHAFTVTVYVARKQNAFETDECGHCGNRGNLALCMREPCSKHDHWWGREVAAVLATLQGALGAYIAVCGNTAGSPMTRETAQELYKTGTAAIAAAHPILAQGSLFEDMREFFHLSCRYLTLTGEERMRFDALRDKFTALGL